MMDDHLIWILVAGLVTMVGKIIFDWMKPKNGSCIMAKRCEEHINVWASNEKTIILGLQTMTKHDIDAKVRSAGSVAVLQQILKQLEKNGDKIDKLRPTA